jgi:hypothetical protein
MKAEASSTSPRWETVSQSEKTRPRHPEPCEGFAFLPYSCRIGDNVPELQSQKQILRRYTPQNDIATQALERDMPICLKGNRI